MQNLKQQRLNLALDTIRARFGDAAIRRLETPDQADTVPHVSTGFPALDHALAIGGFPKGQISHLSGVPTSGATTIALKTLAQADNHAIVYVSVSPTFDADYAARCGVDTDNLLLATPDTIPQAIETLLPLLDTAAIAVLALSDTSTQIGSAEVNRLVNAVRRSACALLIVSRDVASPVARDAAVRLCAQRETWLERHEEVNGYRTGIHILKNQFGPSGQTVSLVIGFHGTVNGDGT